MANSAVEGTGAGARRGVLIWFGAIAILAGFAWLDASSGCAFFQRGGAMLVVYGILMSVLSLRARTDYGAELNAIQLEQCEIAQMMYGAEHEARAETRLRLDRGLEDKLKALDGRLSRLHETDRRFRDLRVVEGPILILGTLVWGFGDLLLRAPGCALPA